MYKIIGITRNGKKVYFAGSSPTDWYWTEEENEAVIFRCKTIAYAWFMDLHTANRQMSRLWFEMSWIECEGGNLI